MEDSSARAYFSSFRVTWFSQIKTGVPKQRGCGSPTCVSSPFFWGQPFQNSPVLCSAFLLLTVKHHLVYPFAPWHPWVAYILCILCTMIETAPFVGSGFAVSSTVTLWKYSLGDYVELNVGRQCCRGMYFMISLLRQHAWVYYFKNKISEAKLLKSHTGLKDRISNHGKTCSHCEIAVFTLTSRNLHWNYSHWREWSWLPIPLCTAQAPIFIFLAFACLYPASLQSRWGKVCDSLCVWFGAADGCEWQTVACVGDRKSVV